MTNTVLDITNTMPSIDNNRAAYALSAGTVILTDCAIIGKGSASGSGTPPNSNNRGVEADHEPSTLTATGTTIKLEGDRQVGACAHANNTEPGGGVVSLTSP
jgi:membrane-bound ClpP family serine protease